MRQISFAVCIGLSPVISTQISLEMSVADPNREKNSLQTPILGFKVVEGHQLWYPRKLISSACYDAQQVCVYQQPFSCWISRQ